MSERLFTITPQPILTAKGATGFGTKMEVKSFQHVVIDFGTSGNTNATVKLQGSIQENVDFTAAASATNRWDYISFVNLQTGAAVAGDTGLAWTGTDAMEIIEANCSGLYFVNIQVSAHAAGAISANGVGFTNK